MSVAELVLLVNIFSISTNRVISLDIKLAYSELGQLSISWCAVFRRYYTLYGVWVWELYRAIDRIGWNPTTRGLEAI
jgi:hypothetical protein